MRSEGVVGATQRLVYISEGKPLERVARQRGGLDRDVAQAREREQVGEVRERVRTLQRGGDGEVVDDEPQPGVTAGGPADLGAQARRIDHDGHAGGLGRVPEPFHRPGQEGRAPRIAVQRQPHAERARLLPPPC